MPTLSVIAAIDVPADRVWEIIGDFADPSAWYPRQVQEHTVTERVVRAADGTRARERLITHDAAARSYTYEERDGLRAVGRVGVESIAGGTMCLVVWSMRFTAPAERQLAVLRELEHTLMRPALRGLRAAFE